MTIYVLVNGSEAEMTLEEVNELLVRGELSLSCPAWQEGMEEWGTLGLVHGVLPPPCSFSTLGGKLVKGERKQEIELAAKAHLRKIFIFSGGIIAGVIALIFSVYLLNKQKELPNASISEPTEIEIRQLMMLLHSTEEEYRPDSLNGEWIARLEVEADADDENAEGLSRWIYSANLTFTEEGRFKFESKGVSASEGTDLIQSFHGLYVTSGGRILLKLDGDEELYLVFNHNSGQLTIQGYFLDGKYEHQAKSEIVHSTKIAEVTNKYNLKLRELLLIKSVFRKGETQ